MILTSLRAAGLAAVTASVLVGCGHTEVSNTSGASSNDVANDEQMTAGGGGSEAEELALPSDSAPSNSAPSVAALCVATPGSAGGYNGSVATQVSDADSAVFNFSVVDAPTQGSLQLDLATGDFNYSPTGSSSGYRDSFSYRVDDLDGGSTEGTAEIIYGALRVMPLGDSITYGVTGYTSATGDIPKPANAVGYRKALYQSLVAEGYLVDFVGDQSAGSGAGLADPEHQGMPGWTSWQIGDAVSAWLDDNPADVALAHVGTNDHTISTDGINHLLNKLNNWSVLNQPLTTVLAQIVDQRPDTFFEDTVEDFNANLAELVDISWPGVVLADHHSALDNQTDLTPLAQDSVGLHPNAGGYQKMAEVWMDALKSSGRLHKCP